MANSPPVSMSMVDLLTGFPLGHVRPRFRPNYRGAGSPREAMERVLREALQRAPCIVAFSGGRDSSAVLALAVDLARREGLQEPLPVTRRFLNAPMS